jgi:hypothetical protein
MDRLIINKRLYKESITFFEGKGCPKCGTELVLLYGCGWDNDRVLCGSKKCSYELELEDTTYPGEAEQE